jgi:hypothetical protein
MFHCGLSKDDIIHQLVKDKEELLRRVCELDMIAPKKITVEGKTLIWRAPAHMVPEI